MKIQTKVVVDSYLDFEGDIESNIDRLRKLQETYSDYTSLYIEPDYNSDRYEYILYGYREETDQEYKIRLENEEIKEANLKNARRRKYEELKKEFDV
jgi:hypothetical protein